MDSGAHKLLESTVHRTLHANGFSRSSSQASLVLTDLLSRYLTLLASTCGKYAEHAGRRRFTPGDAVLALDELGVSVEELKEFGSSEGLELNRYATVKSMRRVEDLAEFRGQLNDGVRGDTDDFIALHYAPLPPEEDLDSDEDADYDDDDDMEIDTEIGVKRPLSPLPTPFSPKRPRTLNWAPPPHIPDFLPPFPKPKEPDAIPPSTTHSPSHGPSPLPDLSSETAGTTVPTQDITAAATSTAASDYLVPVPYSDSSLSSIPEWHLPTPPPRTSSLSLSPQQRWPTPQTEPSLLSAYHHILTTNPPLNASANGGGGPGGPGGVGGGSHPGARHKIAMALLNLIQTQPRWDVADTLWSNVSGNQPRVAPVGPTFPVALGGDSEKEKKERGEKDSKDGKDKEGGGGGKDKDIKFPTTMPRSVAVNEKLSVTVSQPGSRIPELARHVLPPNIFARTSRLTHPPVLSRGSKQLTYGIGVPAPWNANLLPSTDPKDGTTGQGGSVGANSNAKGGPGVNGIIKGEQQAKNVLPDARLFATWDYEVRDYRAPIPGHLRKGRAASSGGGSGHGTTGGVGVVSHGGPGSLQLRGVGGRSASAKAG